MYREAIGSRYLTAVQAGKILSKNFTRTDSLKLDNMKSIFRVVSFLEGISYLLLLFIAVPIKYFSEDASYVKLLGMPHGVLFMLYVVLAFMIKPEQKWDTKTFLFVLLASVIPFGTFYMDKNYLKK